MTCKRAPSRAEHVREISSSHLINRLDDELFALNERLGEATYEDIDWESVVAEIDRLQRCKRELESDSGELARIGAEITSTEQAIVDLETQRQGIDQRIGRVAETLRTARDGAAAAALIAAEPAAKDAARYCDDVAARNGAPPASAEACLTEQSRQNAAITNDVDKVIDRAGHLSRRIVGKMRDFRTAYRADSSTPRNGSCW